MRFVYDLFVFILFWFLRCSRVPFDDARESLGGLRDRLSDPIRERNEEQELVEPLLEERFVHTLVSTFEEELRANAVPFSKPLGCLLGLQAHVVLPGAYLDLDLLGLGNLGFGALSPFFLASLVLEFTIISHFSNGRDRIGRYLDEVEIGCFCGFEGLLE